LFTSSKRRQTVVTLRLYGGSCDASSSRSHIDIELRDRGLDHFFAQADTWNKTRWERRLRLNAGVSTRARERIVGTRMPDWVLVSSMISIRHTCQFGLGGTLFIMTNTSCSKSQLGVDHTRTALSRKCIVKQCGSRRSSRCMNIMHWDLAKGASYKGTAGEQVDMQNRKNRM
jgi:hypothetical protein